MKALLIDDDACILSSAQRELLAFGGSVGLVNVGSAHAARQVLANHADFDFIVLDVQLRDGNGFDLLAELCHAQPCLPVIALSGSELNADAVRSIYLGAVAFVPRRSGGRGLVAALRAVAAGEIHVATPATPATDTWRATSEFTPRQAEVLTLLMKGQSNKTIARGLNLAVDTVKDHVTAVLRCLNVQSRTQAVLAVSRNGNHVAWPAGRDRPDVPRHASPMRSVAPNHGEAAR